MILFFAIFTVTYIVSIAIGMYMVSKIKKSNATEKEKRFRKVLVRSLCYTPTMAIGGGGIALLPTVLALFFTSFENLIFTFIPSAVVFALLWIASIETFDEISETDNE